jgi:LacI family transcriptional regulator
MLIAGLILAGGGFNQLRYQPELSELLGRMARSGVVITTLSPRDVGAATFCVDNSAVGRMAASELVAHGHRKIGVLVGPVHSLVLRQRMEGMRAVFDAERVKYHIMETELRQEAIFAAAKALFEAHPEITAIVAMSSAVSVNAIRAVNATGRSVPGDVSVIGIGGGALAGWSTPQLTRIDLALDVSGRAALDFIAAKVAGENPPEGLVHQPQIVRATSVAQLAAPKARGRRAAAEKA